MGPGPWKKLEGKGKKGKMSGQSGDAKRPTMRPTMKRVSSSVSYLHVIVCQRRHMISHMHVRSVVEKTLLSVSRPPPGATWQPALTCPIADVTTLAPVGWLWPTARLLPKQKLRKLQRLCCPIITTFADTHQQTHDSIALSISRPQHVLFGCVRIRIDFYSSPPPYYCRHTATHSSSRRCQ